MGPRFDDNDPFDPGTAAANMYEGLADEAPNGSENVPLHPWQNFGFDDAGQDDAELDDGGTNYAEYDDDQE